MHVLFLFCFWIFELRFYATCMPAPDIDMIPEVSSDSTWHHVSRHNKQKGDSLESLLSTLSDAVKTSYFWFKNNLHHLLFIF